MAVVAGILKNRCSESSQASFNGAGKGKGSTMESRDVRAESRRSFLKKLAAGGALIWTVPMITAAAPGGVAPVNIPFRCNSDTDCPRTHACSQHRCVPAFCPGDNPSFGHCTTSVECFPGICDFTGCTPSHCYCSPNGWVCTNDCLGHCAL